MTAYPATGSTNWGTPLKAYFDTLSWARAPRVDDLSYPLVIAHRGAADLEAESTTAAFRNAAALGFQATEAGDVQALPDGTLVVMHDSTVDRTTTGTGNVTSFNRTTWATLSTDVQTVQGGSYVAQPAAFWDDSLTALAGNCVVVPEIKDSLDSTATAVCDRLDAIGARESAIIQSFTLSNVTIAAGRGYKTMLLAASFAGLPTLAAARAAGIWSVSVDYTAGDFNATNVAIWQGAGFRVIAYTVDLQVNAATVLAAGVDGFFTNQSRDYMLSTVANYRQASTRWHMTGKFDPGVLTAAAGPQAAFQRGTLTGSPGSWRLAVPLGKWVVAGSVSPVANAAGTYTITVNMLPETMPSDTTKGPGFYFAMANDSLANNGADLLNSYIVKMRCNGTLQMWEINGAGTATSLGTKAYTAINPLTTTATLVAGVAVTSISVSALPTALKIGHQFMLPTGQVATLSANALVSATSITVTSITPSAAVNSGSTLKPYLTVSVAVTAANLTATRVDEAATGNIVAADTAHRGGYIAVSGQVMGGDGLASYHKIAIS